MNGTEHTISDNRAAVLICVDVDHLPAPACISGGAFVGTGLIRVVTGGLYQRADLAPLQSNQAALADVLSAIVGEGETECVWNLYVYMHVYVYVHMHVCVYIYIYTRMNVSVHA